MNENVSDPYEGVAKALKLYGKALDDIMLASGSEPQLTEARECANSCYANLMQTLHEFLPDYAEVLETILAALDMASLDIMPNRELLDWYADTIGMLNPVTAIKATLVCPAPMDGDMRKLVPEICDRIVDDILRHDFGSEYLHQEARAAFAQEGDHYAIMHGSAPLDRIEDALMFPGKPFPKPQIKGASPS
jgi:hypothetical protein